MVNPLDHVDVASMEFRNPLHELDQNILLEKLYVVTFSKNLLAFLKSYLTGYL